jgi:NADPH:quinone reductase-like Zn-dependent oxidoreductase
VHAADRPTRGTGQPQISMKAVVQDRYGPPDVLELKDVAEPAVGADEVLVRVHAAGLDQGVWHLMTGLPYLVRLAGYGLRAPKNPIRGYDVAGLVEAVGEDVTGFRPGDEVFGTCEGAFAELARARADRLARKPAALGFEQAAVVPISGCAALQAVRDRGRVQPGRRVLVIGAGGGVGTFAVQLAKAYGAHVTGVCSTSKTDLVLSLGADRAIDYTREDFVDEDQQYDVILDIAGNRPLLHLRGALAPKGVLVIVGGEGGGRWLGGFDRQLRAVALSPFVGQKLGTWISTPRREDLEELSGFLESGELVPVLDRTFPLSEAPEAVRYLRKGHARGKIVIAV